MPAAGGVNSNIKELSLWMLAQMGAMPDVLSPNVLNTIHAPLVKTPGERGRLRKFLERLGEAVEPALRRRGVTPEALRAFAENVGVARKPARTELSAFEHAVRDDLNMRVPRVLCVARPLKVVLTNYPEGQEEWLDAPYYPHDVPLTGSRALPFSRELYIERDDFMEDPPKKFFRFAPGREVRLRSAYFITCTGVVKDENGTITELRCTYDPATRGGQADDRGDVEDRVVREDEHRGAVRERVGEDVAAAKEFNATVKGKFGKPPGRVFDDFYSVARLNELLSADGSLPT